MSYEKISLKGLSEVLSEKELKNVLGGGSDAEPCENNGCPGPHGKWMTAPDHILKFCCILPCNGIFHKYGYGFVSGMNACPW